LKSALLIVTEIAASHFESGAKKRLSSIVFHLESLGYDIEIQRLNEFIGRETIHKDLVVVVSYACAKAIPKARREADFLWFDATDSWNASRISRFFRGEITQIVALMRDYFYLRKVKYVDLLTFISARDLQKESRFAEKKSLNIYVLPNLFTQSKVSQKKLMRLVFIGDGSYGPNRKALRFLRRVIIDLPPDKKITVIGRNLLSNSDGLVCVGYVEDKELYYLDDIHIVPIFSGAGIKNKVTEPLALGLRVITTPEGANGIVNNPNLHVCESATEFANKILELDSKGYATEMPEGNIYLDDETSKVIKLLREIT
jgi:glycosyltransferase involved in cell wall biosynthesis